MGVKNNLILKSLFLIILFFYNLSINASEIKNCNIEISKINRDLLDNDPSNRHFNNSWYKIHIEKPCDLLKNEEVAFSLKTRNVVAKVYSNNFLIYHNNDLPHPLSSSWSVPLYLTIPKETISDKNNFLMVNIIGLPTDSLNISEVIVGNSYNLKKEYEKEKQKIFSLQVLNFSFTLTLGILAFFIWVFQRNEIAFGWFSLTSFCWSILMIGIIIREEINFISNQNILVINIITFFSYCLFFCFFTWRFAKKNHPRIEKALLLSVFLIIFLSFLLKEYNFILLLNATFLGGVILILINSFYFFFIAFKERNTEIYLLGFVFFIYLVVGIFDLVLLLVNYNKNLVSPYAAPVTALFITIILALRLSNNIKQIESFNDNLEIEINRVKEDLTSSLLQQHKLALENTLLQERMKLAHDLHDGLGGSLVRSIMMINQDEKNINKSQFISILKSLRDDLRQIVDSGSSDDNKIPKTPIILFASVRHRFTQLFEQFNIKVFWSFPENWLVQPTSIECLTYLRITEEALTNILKHSYAKNVYIIMNYDKKYLILSIKDDGTGFDVDAVKKSDISIGIKSMERRSDEISAHLHIKSSPEGTQIIVQKKVY